MADESMSRRASDNTSSMNTDVLNNLTSRIHGLEVMMDRVVHTLDDLARRGQTQWGTLGTWAAVIIALISAITTLGVGVPLSHLRNEVIGNREARFASAYEQGRRDSEIAELKRQAALLEGRVHQTDRTRFSSTDWAEAQKTLNDELRSIRQKLNAHVEHHLKGEHP